MEIEKQELIRTLIESAVAQVVRIDGMKVGEEAFAEVRSRLASAEAFEEFNTRKESYIFDGLFRWLHREPCLLIDLNWQDLGSALYQLKSLGWSDIDAMRAAVNGPYVEGEMSTSEKEVLMSLLTSERKVEPNPEPKTRQRSGSDLSVSQVAKLLQVSRTTVIGLISTGKLSAFSAALPGAKRNSWRISQAALDEFRGGKSTSVTKEKREPVRRRKRLPPVNKYV